MTKEIPLEDRPAGGSDDTIYDEAGVNLGSLATPIKFAMHAVFYYAGRAADKIVSLYNSAFKLDRDYVGDFNKSSGIACARNGNWKKAIPLLEKALAITPGDPDIQMHLAEAYGAANQLEKAGQHLEKILEGNPNSARTVRALGILHLRRQDYERAVEYLEKAVELDPDHAQTYYRLGSAYDNRKQYDQAVESFRKAILLDPRLVKAYQALGFTYESMGERKSAVECFKKALELE